jgi:hypothetical protein
MTFQVLIVVNDMTMVLLPVAPHSLGNKTSTWAEPTPSIFWIDGREASTLQVENIRVLQDIPNYMRSYPRRPLTSRSN